MNTLIESIKHQQHKYIMNICIFSVLDNNPNNLYIQSFSVSSHTSFLSTIYKYIYTTLFNSFDILYAYIDKDILLTAPNLVAAYLRKTASC